MERYLAEARVALAGEPDAHAVLRIVAVGLSIVAARLLNLRLLAGHLRFLAYVRLPTARVVWADEVMLREEVLDLAEAPQAGWCRTLCPAFARRLLVPEAVVYTDAARVGLRAQNGATAWPDGHGGWGLVARLPLGYASGSSLVYAHGPFARDYAGVGELEFAGVARAITLVSRLRDSVVVVYTDSVNAAAWAAGGGAGVGRAAFYAGWLSLLLEEAGVVAFVRYIPGPENYADMVSRSPAPPLADSVAFGPPAPGVGYFSPGAWHPFAAREGESPLGARSLVWRRGGPCPAACSGSGCVVAADA